MATAYNYSEVVLNIGGDVNVLADVDDAVMFEEVDAFNETWGAQGDLMVVGTGRRGGYCQVTCLPIPPFEGGTAVWVEWDNTIQQIRDGEPVDPEDGSLAVPNKNYQLLGGFPKRGPLGQDFGAGSAGNRVYSWIFREVRNG